MPRIAVRGAGLHYDEHGTGLMPMQPPGERRRAGSTVKRRARALVAVGSALVALVFAAERMGAGAAPSSVTATPHRTPGASAAPGGRDLVGPARATDAGGAGRDLEAYLRIAAGGGREQAAAAFIRERLGRGLPARSDALGNLTVTFGSGRPRRLVACPLGEPGFVVSRIDGDGYLRLAAAQPDSPAGALWQQAHEGQLVWVASGHGGIPG